MKDLRFRVSWFLLFFLFTAILFGIPLAKDTAIAEEPMLEVQGPVVVQQSTAGFCAVEFPNGDELATVVESLGAGVVLQTFDHDSSPAQWSAQLDLAQSYGLEVIAWLWPEGWEWDGNDWQIDSQARSFVQTVAAHPATLAIYALHEPYWRSCPTCGLTTAQQQALYQEIKAIADIPLYSEIGSVTYWADQGQDTTLDDGVCDYCAVWYFPFFADGTYGNYSVEAPFVTGLFYGGGWELLIAQFISVIVVFVWAFGLGYLMFKLMDLAFGIRVSPEEELQGLNIPEHGTPAYPDFVSVRR